MFGSNKPVVLESYGQRRKRRVLPRWLVLLLAGVAVGAIGVIFIQERYLPPRLSAQASSQLRSAFEQAESERLRLKGETEAATKRIETMLAEKKTLVDELAASRQTTDRLRGDLTAMVASLPPDPRGGTVEVRAARFSKEGADLVYDVVLSRERSSKPLVGIMQLVLSGDSSKGGDTTLTLKPVAVSVVGYQSLRGSVPLPDGFSPRQATINVLDRPEGRLLGMRVMYVK